MIGKNIDITPMESFFLMTLYNPPPLSGSEIVKKLEENLGVEWIPSPGATYKILQSLVSKGLIQETTEEQEREDQRIRTYTITEEGKKTIPKVIIRIQKISDFVNECCPDCCSEDNKATKIILRSPKDE